MGNKCTLCLKWVLSHRVLCPLCSPSLQPGLVDRKLMVSLKTQLAANLGLESSRAGESKAQDLKCLCHLPFSVLFSHQSF